MPVDSRNVNHYLGRDLTRPQEMKFIHKNDTVLVHSSKHIPCSARDIFRTPRLASVIVQLTMSELGKSLL